MIKDNLHLLRIATKLFPSSSYLWDKFLKRRSNSKAISSNSSGLEHACVSKLIIDHKPRQETVKKLGCNILQSSELSHVLQAMFNPLPIHFRVDVYPIFLVNASLLFVVTKLPFGKVFHKLSETCRLIAQVQSYACFLPRCAKIQLFVWAFWTVKWLMILSSDIETLLTWARTYWSSKFPGSWSENWNSKLSMHDKHF